MITLTGKRCLIVGGTSGIGLAAARAFRAAGAQVAVVGLPGTDDAIRDRLLADRIVVIQADVRDPEAVGEVLRGVEGELSGLDVLYHVAGASGRRYGDGPLHECSDAGWNWTLASNLSSTFLTCRAAVRYWLARSQPGTILTTASVLALSPSVEFFDTISYATAKAGVIALTRQIAARYASSGIRANVMAPGLIATPMAERAVADPAIAAFLRSKQPLSAGPGSPEDLADLAVFLCSDAARLITGAVVTADGGWSLTEGVSSA